MSQAPTAAEEALASPDAIRRDWMRLAAATMAFSLGFGIYHATFPPFAANTLALTRPELGQLESLREVPGLLAAGMIGVLAVFAEPRLASMALAVVALGFALTGRATGLTSVVVFSVTWSIGLHIWLTVQPSLTMRLSPPRQQGRGLGMMQRFGSLATLAGLAWAFLFAAQLDPQVMFVVAAAFVGVGCVFAARVPAARGGSLEQRLLFRPQYWRYYLLALLDGGRRVVVMTFAMLILILEFGVDRQNVAFIFFINAALMMAMSPIVGGWTDRYGERRVLSIYYALVIAVFALYTQVRGLSETTGLAPMIVFAVIYALDNLLFSATVGIQTYIRHSAPPRELSPSLAMGVTMNHIAAVSVPWAAGYIWQAYGYERIFACGIGLAAASLVVALLLPRHVPEEAAPA